MRNSIIHLGAKCCKQRGTVIFPSKLKCFSTEATGRVFFTHIGHSEWCKQYGGCSHWLCCTQNTCSWPDGHCGPSSRTKHSSWCLSPWWFDPPLCSEAPLRSSSMWWWEGGCRHSTSRWSEQSDLLDTRHLTSRMWYLGYLEVLKHQTQSLIDSGTSKTKC